MTPGRKPEDHPADVGCADGQQGARYALEPSWTMPCTGMIGRWRMASAMTRQQQDSARSDGGSDRRIVTE